VKRLFVYSLVITVLISLTLSCDIDPLAGSRLPSVSINLQSDLLFTETPVKFRCAESGVLGRDRIWEGRV